jgi:hypothetical protein
MDMIQFKLVMVMFQVDITQPELGHLQKIKYQPLKYLKGRVDENNEFKNWSSLNVDSFLPGQLVI